MINRPPKILVIVGPTASGKSELAVKIAKRFHGEIISADSRQVYRGLNLGSGKVQIACTPEVKNPKTSHTPLAPRQAHMIGTYKGIRHHLIDVVSPRKTFTVAHYEKLARKALEDILRRGTLPIICGGTGFYIDALIHDHVFPRVAPDALLRKKLEKKSKEELFAWLSAYDPRRARSIDRKNTRRLIRAIEIVLATRHPVPMLGKRIYAPILTRFDISGSDIAKIGIRLNREKLKARIHARLQERLGRGLIEEVRALHAQGVSWQRLDDFGLEYRYVSRHLRGRLSEEEMQDAIVKESMRYAKRQMSYWKRDRTIIWSKGETEALFYVSHKLFSSRTPKQSHVKK